MAPIVVALVWWHPVAVAVLAGIAAAIGAFEICTMYAASGMRASRGAGAVLASLLVIRWVAEGSNRGWLDIAIVIVAATALLRQLWHPRHHGRFISWGLGTLAATYVGGLLGLVVYLRRLPEGFSWVLLALLVTWAYDSGAYLAGRALGKHAFMAHISPRKTWEGVAGGIIATTCVTAAFVPLLPLQWWHVAPLGIAWAAAAQAGDLVESMIKRDTGHKNSGVVVPGHGGMLDRIDSLLFVIPTVLVIARVTG